MSLQTLTPDVASVLGIPVEQGVLVAEVDVEVRLLWPGCKQGMS